MRTKLFFAFIFIIFFTILSNVVFERLVIRDFNDYLGGIEEDHIYWVMASVEGSSSQGVFDMPILGEALHWGLMLGFESYVEDIKGNRILSSTEALSSMNKSMMNRMQSLLKLPSGTGEFRWYPLYVEGEEIGKLYVRPAGRPGSIKLKEEIFRERGREFLIISFLIAGAGALVLSILFTIFISNPIRRLTRSAEKIAKGDFSVQSPVRHGRLKDEIDRLTETFNFMAEALRREDALRKHLTSNVAHELRTPLTIIKGNLEGIEDGVVDPDKVMKNINSEIERIISLVEGIEDITSAEASFFKKGTREKISLSDFVESVADGMRKIAKEKGLYLKTEGPTMTVQTYPEKLHIILKNLISNACKFTAEGGVTVRWGNSDSKAGFYISVSDTGKGIPEGEQGRVFERFYKEAASGGKGLGLAIVKEVAGIMGGRVDIESSSDEGAKFIVSFNEK
ncbi:signal transduction histidine-protein kinase BaeS [bacterium BMS3Abin09]|nr:signal transduction histidine-protein kinase BaeS [bacterium BMS3Abin09]GBE41818.1 signal transduction histidine-protein kinase BaeS [bacterium BMS3Bbin09]HDH34942.1 HAMP domain-containing histidine kinase [Nitrospirota bacterium]